ncbi:MAG: DNA phosphorothioation system sulfurtransferase DndC [Balneolaceae bacterium]
MGDNGTNNPSVFDSRTLKDIIKNIQEIYLEYPQPWVIGYSGGKDSTAVLQLVWLAIDKLPKEKRKKKVYVIASDTKVETPVIVDHLDGTLERINSTAKEKGLPFHAQKVMPTLNDSFWVNLIGRGYPAPTTRFRWCTDRMKIKPANRFIEEKVTEHGEVIMLLGVREQESSTRQQLMRTYQVKEHVLRRHTSLPGAYVYAPIADWSVDDVWTFLFQVESPWGNNNRDLAAMYRDANAGECPLVIDDSTPSCGNSRFGCWVCTVAEKDSSMQAMIDNGEDWMEPLLEIRNFLKETTDPEKKREYRSIKGRDGRVFFKNDTELAARTYKLDTLKKILKDVLIAQKKINEQVEGSETTLISKEELHEIRRLWKSERGDWDDSVPAIFRDVFGYDLIWPKDDDGYFDSEQKRVLNNLCQEHDVPFELMAKLLEMERQSMGMAKRAKIHKKIASVLNEEWRSEEEILEENVKANSLTNGQ